MGRLNGSRLYMSGPIDRAIDNGIHWRVELTKWLKPLNIVALDPCNKPTSLGQEILEYRDKRHALKKEGKFLEVKQIMKKIVEIDLRMLDISDFIVMYLDPDIYTCGTFWECCYAIQQHKPVLTVIKGGLANLPDWLFGVLDINEVFDSFDELKQYICQVDSNGVELSNKWKLFNLMHCNPS